MLLHLENAVCVVLKICHSNTNPDLLNLMDSTKTEMHRTRNEPNKLNISSSYEACDASTEHV